MPETLHGWFMDMFRYGHDSDAAQIVRDILRLDGIFSNREVLCSAKGSSFLSTLAEADPAGALALIEHTIGQWSPEEILAFETNRQNIVWALEKIAVWRPTFVRVIRMLARLARKENSNYSNNATGTLSGLFHIGPEFSATETSPTERLPAMLEMFQAGDDDLKRMGLKVAKAALRTSGGLRIVGAEYQGIKERARLWRPDTYGEWWDEYRRYWDCLVNETRKWGDDLRKEANSAIIEATAEQLQVASHAEMVLSVLEQLVTDQVTDMRVVSHFIIQRRRWNRDDRSVSFRLRRLDARFARRSLESRFQRYVLYTTWEEWSDYQVQDEAHERTRPRMLVRALAGRVARKDEAFDRLLSVILTSNSETAALSYFGEHLCLADADYRRLERLLSVEGSTTQCLGGYLYGLKKRDEARWRDILLRLLRNVATAKLGADLVWRTGFNVEVLDAWLDAFECGWIAAGGFRCLGYGKSWEAVPTDRMVRLLTLLSEREDPTSAYMLIDLLGDILVKEIWPIDSDFVYKAVTSQAHFEESQRHDTTRSYHWHNVCERLVARDSQKAIPLLDVLLRQMRNDHGLSYDHYIAPLAQALCRIKSAEAWDVVASHLLSAAPKWRGDVMNWLKGGIGGFGDGKNLIPPIAEFPLQAILDWIAQDPEDRSSMIAHCAPYSLDDEYGGALTRALLAKYRNVDGVLGGISANFHSGGWSGPESQYLRKKRERLRVWLGKGFELNVVSWIEDEITRLDRQIESSEISEERESWNRPSGT